MNSNNETTIPKGLYVLSGLLLLSIILLLYYGIAYPSYTLIAIILIPLFIYMGVGIVKRWPGSRQTVMVFVFLLFILSLLNISAVLFMEEAQELSSAGGTIRNIARLAILPFVFFYLRSEKVKSYFKPAT